MKPAPVVVGSGATVGAAFAATAWRHPHDRAHLAPAGPVLDWAEMAAEVRHRACGLVELGAPVGAAVAIDPGGGVGTRLQLLAVASAGLVADLSDGARSGSAAPEVVIHGRPVTDSELATVGRVRDARDPGSFEDRLAQVPPDAPAVVLGSRPFTHDQLLWAARSFVQAVGLHSGDRVVTDLPISDEVGHVVGHLAPLVVGAACGAMGLELLADVRPTVLVAGETSVRRLTPWPRGQRPGRRPSDRRARRRHLDDQGLSDCRSLVAVESGDVSHLLGPGGPPLSVAARFAGVAGVVTLGEPRGPADAGRPAPGTSVGIGSDGEVLVRSPAASASGGWMATGRTGSLDRTGRLHLDGGRAAGVR